MVIKLLASILLLSSCCHASGKAESRYQVFTLAPNDNGEFKGKLKAKDEKDDKDVSFCAPDEKVKGKCIVMETRTYGQIEKDIAFLEKLVRECQSKP